MIRAIYLLRNLTRNPTRSTLTCAAVALPIMIMVLATAVVEGIDQFLENTAKHLRLAVVHKGSIINPLPMGHVAKIRSLDPTRHRLVSVCGVRWIGGKVPDNPMPLSTLAVEPNAFLATFPDYELPPSELAGWRRDRQALIVGRGIAVKMGWRVGDRVTIQSSVPPYDPLEFHVVSLADQARDPITLWCREDYYSESLKGTGMEDLLSFIFVKCGSKEDLEYFTTAIDELFARTPDETKTQDEKTFLSDFVAQQFDLQRNLTILSIVTVFVAIMAGANTLCMNFRDRINELATMKALGFGGWSVFGLLQVEGLILCLGGGLLGALGPYIAFTHTPLREYPVPLIQHLDIEPVVCVQAIGVSMLVGVVAALWPAWSGLRLAVVTALRQVE